MKNLFKILVVMIMITSLQNCKQELTSDFNNAELTTEEKSLVSAAGFNANWAERTHDGGYLIEGDIFLKKHELESLVGNKPVHNIIVANEEHYRTTNLVSTPKTIYVYLPAGLFPAHYSTGLDQALARYNSLNLLITFVRTSIPTPGQTPLITISGANLGRGIGGGCILGRSAGFPDAAGNPAPGFTLSTTRCATQYLNTANKADEVIAHEIGHAIGFRHTDYATRSSCGSNSNEGDAGVGAIHIPGTPTTNEITGSYNSWMMACTNGNPAFSASDNAALNYIY